MFRCVCHRGTSLCALVKNHMPLNSRWGKGGRVEGGRREEETAGIIVYTPMQLYPGRGLGSHGIPSLAC